MDTNEKDSEYWFNEGEELNNEGKYDGAIECYDKAIELNHENLRALNRKGGTLLVVGKHDEAIECYDKIIGVKPDHPAGWYGKGLAFKSQEKYEDALECCNKALELASGEEWIIKGKSEILYHLGVNSWEEDFEKCVSCLETALQLGLSDASNKLEAHAILGNVYFRKLDRCSDAIKEYENALETDNTEFEGKYLSSISLGEGESENWRNNVIEELTDCYGNEAHTLLTEHDEVDKAIELCKKGLSLDETCVICQVVLGNSYWAKKSWEDTIETYSQVDIESLEPSLIITVIGQLLDAYRYINDFNSTSKYCEMALKTDNQSENILLSESNRESLIGLLVHTDYNIALELFGSEDYDLAIKVIDKLLEYNPKHLEGLCLKGRCLILLHDIDGAFECFSESLQIDFNCVEALVGIGTSFYHRGELDKANEYYDKALDIEPNNENALILKKIASNEKNNAGPDDEWVEKGRLLAVDGKYTEAIECFNKALELNDTHVACLFYKGVSLYGLDQYKKSIEYFDKVLKIDTEHGEAWHYKGQCLLILEDYDGSLECLNQADKLNPSSVETLRLKGLALSFLEKYEEAKYWFDKAIEIDPENENVLSTMGAVLYESGKYEDAREYYDKALALNPENEQIVKERGRIADAINDVGKTSAEKDEEREYIEKAFEFSKLDEYEKVVECLDRAIILNPKNPVSWYHKGLALSIMFKHRAALECYDKVIEIDPEYEAVQQRREDKIRAIEGVEVLQSENTENGLYWYTLAENRLEEDKKDIDTLNAFENALKLGDLTPFEEARSNALLAMMYGGRDRKNEMKVCLKKALQLNDANEDILRKKDKELYAGACKYYATDVESTDEAIRLLETPMELGFEDLYSFFDYNYLAVLYNKSADESADFDTKIYKLEKSIDYLKKAEETAPYPEWARDERSTINERQNKINGLRHPEIEIRNNPEKMKEVQAKISNLKSKTNHLTNDRTKKFSEAGEMAYSECMENVPNLAPDAQTELDAILAIDTLISKTNQEMEKAKGGKKKTGLLGKLGDAVSSVAKQGKLKVELYNLERKKNSAITDFGEVLWASHKSGNDALQELSDIWQAIEDIEQQIHENEEEIDNLNGLLG